MKKNNNSRQSTSKNDSHYKHLRNFQVAAEYLIDAIESGDVQIMDNAVKNVKEAWNDEYY